MTTFVSRWRCDKHGEEFSAALTPIVTMVDGKEIELRGSVDIHVGGIPCPIGGCEMRRIDTLEARSRDE